MNKESFFESILSCRIAFYRLVDLGTMKEDEITSFEESQLSLAGFEIGDYLCWKDQ